MFYTEKEIMSQHEALKDTFAYFMEEKPRIEQFFSENPKRKFIILGCGSSYMLAKSAQRALSRYEGTSAAAVAGGDFLLNSDLYDASVRDSIVITLSRSGMTTEIVKAVEFIKENYKCPVISFSMLRENDLSKFSDLELIMDWCYDKSVCQTRTVTNLYAAVLMLAGFYGKDMDLVYNLRVTIEENEALKKKYRADLARIAEKGWKNAAVLADGVPCGIAQEGALAFTEIARIPGRYSNVLDYRHGPMVLNDYETLDIVLIKPGKNEMQKNLVEDLKAKGAVIVTVSCDQSSTYGSDLHIFAGESVRYETWGIVLISVIQILAYEKAIVRGCNPDLPEGLDPYIVL